MVTTQVARFKVHSSGVQSRFYRETIVHPKAPQPTHEKPTFNG